MAIEGAFTTVINVVEIVLIILIARELFGVGYPKKEGGGGSVGQGIKDLWNKAGQKDMERQKAGEELGQAIAALTMDEHKRVKGLIQAATNIQGAVNNANFVNNNTARTEVMSFIDNKVKTEIDTVIKETDDEIVKLKTQMKTYNDEIASLEKERKNIVIIKNREKVDEAAKVATETEKKESKLAITLDRDEQQVERELAQIEMDDKKIIDKFDSIKKSLKNVKDMYTQMNQTIKKFDSFIMRNYVGEDKGIALGKIKTYAANTKTGLETIDKEYGPVEAAIRDEFVKLQQAQKQLSEIRNIEETIAKAG